MDSLETPDDEPPRTLENQPPTSPKPKGSEWENQQHPPSSEVIQQTLEDILPTSEITLSTLEKRKEDQLPNTSEYQSSTSSEAKTEKLQLRSSASLAVRKREAISDEGLATSRKKQKMDPDAIQRQSSGTAEYKSPDTSEANSSKLAEIEQHSLPTAETTNRTLGDILSMSGLGLSAEGQEKKQLVHALEYQSPTSTEKKSLGWVENEQPYSPSSNSASSTTEEENGQQPASAPAYRPPTTSSEDENLKWGEKEQQQYPESGMMKHILTGTLSTSEMLSSNAIKEDEQQSSSTLEDQQYAVKMLKEASEDTFQNTEMKIPEDMEVIFEITMNRFEEWASFEMFSLSRYGLNLQQSDIDRIADENNLVQERKRQILIKWMKNNNDASSDSLYERKYRYAAWVACILKDVDEFRKFILSPRGLCLNALGIQDISGDDIRTEHGMISIMKKKWETKNGGKEMTTSMLVALLDNYADAKIFEIMIESFKGWSSFELFALSLHGLKMQESDIARISEENDSVEERKNRILLKWMENNKNATASYLYGRVQNYQICSQNYYFLGRLLEDLEEFRKFALSPNGLCLNAFDIEDIIEDDRSSDYTKILLIRKKWETKHGKELTALTLVGLVERYLDAALLHEVKDFLSNVEEFRKFALSRVGLHLNESDIRDILEDDRISRQQKNEQMKYKWKEKMGKKQEADSLFDNCMLKYAKADCIRGVLIRRVWIPNFREQYSHEEAQPLQGKLIDVVPFKPVDVWFSRGNYEKRSQVGKLNELKRHTNVAKFIDCGNREGYIFVAMERAWTDTLSDALQTKLDDKVSIGLCLQLLKGLVFLHEHVHLVHRALSPRAILVSADRKSLKITGYYLLNSNNKFLDAAYHAPEYLKNKPVSQKTNIYAAALLLTEILSNGRHSFSDILSESEQKVGRKILDFTRIRASNKLLVEELFIPMTKLDPESRPTALEVLRDFTFLAYEIRSKKAEADLKTFIRCRKTTEHNEEILQWRRHKTGVLTDSTSCLLKGSRRTEPNIVRAAMRNRTVTDEDVNDVLAKISSMKPYQECSVEFSDCNIKEKQFALFFKDSKSVHKISKLVVSYTDNIKELIPVICSIIVEGKIRSLSLEYDDLDDDAVDLLYKQLQGKHKLKELDISYNKDITSTGYEKIGHLLQEFYFKGEKSHYIETLKGVDCDITDGKIKNLLGNLPDVKLKELDISCNKDITPKGFAILAEFIAKNGITSLRMSGCCLTDEAINVLHEHLPQRNSELLLKELDLSYNPAITPNSSLGSIIVKCGIKKLNLAGCRLDEEHFSHMRESTDQHKMDTVCVRDNFTIGDGLVEIAELVKRSKLKELDISNCAFSAFELKRFRDELEGAELQRLYLGDKERECDVSYMEEICNFFPNVADALYLQLHQLNEASRHVLMKRLEECMVMIKLSDGSTEQWSMQKGIA